jgi:hypothetical protein
MNSLMHSKTGGFMLWKSFNIPQVLHHNSGYKVHL